MLATVLILLLVAVFVSQQTPHLSQGLSETRYDWLSHVPSNTRHLDVH